MPNRVVVVFLIFSFLFLFSLIFFLILFFFLFYSSGSEDSTESHSNLYLYQEINPSNKRSTHGFARLSVDMLEEDYISYHNSETGTHVVISTFGGPEFECVGSCACSNTRRSSTALNRALTLLFTAFSTTSALKIADEVFRDQCLQHFATSCDEENIQSDVQSCEEKELDEENDFLEYSCEGNCVKNDFIITDHGLRAQEKFGDCERLRYYVKSMLMKKVHVKSEYEMERFAEVQFLGKHLNNYCVEASTLMFNWPRENGRDMLKRGNMCIATNDELTRISGKKKGYPHIKCHRKRENE